MISSTLKAIFLGGVLPAMLTAASAAFPPFGVALSLPIIGPGIRKLIDWCFDWLIDKGVIELKVGLIDVLSEKAKRDYEPMIALLREAQSRPALTPEEEAEYAKKLQEVIRNRPGIVNG